MNRLSGRECLGLIISQVMRPGCFFTGRGVGLKLEHIEREDEFWEIDRGRLLSAGQTRNARSFECWNVRLQCPESFSSEPVISVKLDLGGGSIHVTRSLLCYAWEGFAAEENVILSREVQKWVPELVGTIDLGELLTEADLGEELAALIYRAVVGTSRLPLTSVESPLPSFSLGQLGYFPALAGKSIAADQANSLTVPELLAAGLEQGVDPSEQAKLVELLVRACGAAKVSALACDLAGAWLCQSRRASEFIALCRSLINETALSPYSDFVDKFLSLLDNLRQIEFLSDAQFNDFESYILRHLARHLTAYDLVTYHHRGANYPDALLLDAVLKDYLQAMENSPGQFIANTRDSERDCVSKRMRRRALRQAWLMRQSCVGLLVPDMPTSSGENKRVLPHPFARVPEDQITNPDKRTKRLFADEPVIDLGPEGRRILQQSATDLDSPSELRELGMALFLDRPLGVFKEPGQPDQTPLLSYETFSCRIALQRLEQLARNPQLAPLACLPRWDGMVRGELAALGLPLRPSCQTRRPGAVSLDDAVRVSGDFRVLRNTRGPLRQCLQAFDLSPLSRWNALELAEDENVCLFLQAASIGIGDRGELRFFDRQMRTRMQVKVDTSLGYVCLWGREYPTAGLLVQHIWTPSESGGDLHGCDVVADEVRLLPRFT